MCFKGADVHAAALGPLVRLEMLPEPSPLGPCDSVSCAYCHRHSYATEEAISVTSGKGDHLGFPRKVYDFQFN